MDPWILLTVAFVLALGLVAYPVRTRRRQRAIDRMLADADRLPAARRPHLPPVTRGSAPVSSLHRLSQRDARDPRLVRADGETSGLRDDLDSTLVR
jgi:hypothetical protein